VGVGLGVLGLAVAAALPILVPVFHFPHPTGPYQVGTLTYHWVDAARPEVFTADPNDRRELVAADQPSYPVLIFLHGFSGFRQHNTFQVQELVSHGYIVAAIDQPYAAASVVFPDGRQAVGLSRDQMKPLVRASYTPVETAPTRNGQTFNDGIVPYLAQDARFTLDQLAALNKADPNGILTGRLDLQRAGIFGISLGGIVGPEACRLEPRLRACLVMDAPMPTDVVRAGLRQPTMWITRDAETMQREGWSKQEIDEHQTSMRAVFQSLPGDGYFVRVRGMFHLNLTDYSLVAPLLPLTGITGPIDAQRAHRIINAYSLAFFDRHLKGEPAALLDGPAAHNIPKCASKPANRSPRTEVVRRRIDRGV